MPYIKYLTFKSGISPSLRSQFDMNFLTGTQKLMLTESRIFGNRIGSNYSAGTKILRSRLKGAKRLSIYDIPIWDHTQMFPFAKDFEKNEFRQEVLEDRKMRILMRGVKIGKKKGGTGFSLMNIFEKKSDKPPEAKGEKKGGDAKKTEAKPAAEAK